jgi:hypothetical protein
MNGAVPAAMVVRGCPLGNARDCSEWHASGMAGEDDGGGACRLRHQLNYRVRPVPGPPASLARATGPRQAAGGNSKPRASRSSSGDPGREGVLTCGFFAPVVTVRARRDQQFPMPCGPSTDRVATRWWHAGEHKARPGRPGEGARPDRARLPRLGHLCLRWWAVRVSG